jgi:cytochrome P450
MVDIGEAVDVGSLPLAPKSPLPYWQRWRAARAYHTGCETLRDAGGPVTRNSLGPKWMLPPYVVTTSPKGARDVLSRSYPFVDRELPVFDEQRRLNGGSLFNFKHDAWLPRRRALQPVFTKQHVTQFAGHMAEGADKLARMWSDGAELDLDEECRTVTLRVLGRSVLGLDVDGRADALSGPLRTIQTYILDRGVRPVRAPAWLPTPARRRARAANDTFQGLADDILQTCRADPTRDAPLVRALIAATDPATGTPLSDDDIRHELVVFLGAGYDTTATTLTYALWALGHHRDLQDRVAAEVAELGDRRLTSDDVPRLGYTDQVVHEALRLCPPGAATFRTAMKDFDVDGYRVEAGSWVMVGIYAMHRDPALWDNPLVFDPDRFSPERSKGRDRWQYLPFGGGPRSCIGDHFATLEATLGLASIVRLAQIRSLDDDFPVALPLTMVAGAPIPARVYPRSRSASASVNRSPRRLPGVGLANVESQRSGARHQQSHGGTS